MSNRNSNAHFSLAPQVSIQRSTFDRSFDVKTSFNVGELVPFYVDEVLPGDTFEITTSKVARLQTLITPVMDNLYLDTYYFFVPNRLVWEHWQNFCGENTESKWTDNMPDYTVPVLATPSGGFQTGTIADYFGVPVGVDIPDGVNALPFRAYALICNEWFRDENLTDPIFISKGDATQTGSNGSDYRNDCALGGKPFIAAKSHDRYTSALPAPQRGESVSIPVGGFAPVQTLDVDSVAGTWHDNTIPEPLHLSRWVAPEPYSMGHFAPFSTSKSYVPAISKAPDGGYSTLKVKNDSTEPSVLTTNVYPSNLWANLGAVNSISINSLRMAFQIQRLLERDARSGTRYIEQLNAHFGVQSPDARLQRPEYLGGNRVPLDVSQVAQTSSTDNVTPMATLAAFSQTNDVNHDVTKSFVEHGYIIGLCVARYDHTYQQGLDPMWSRRGRFDFYWPALAHIGEQAIKNKEIYCTGNVSADNQVFGYQEAWSEYRYKPNIVTGQMRSSYAQSLDVWHFADDYDSMPYLSDAWIREDASNVDRALAVQSTSGSSQIFADILVANKVTRPMPLYSIPGMIDHF